MQDILIEVYRSIGEPDSLYGCGGGKLINPLTRFNCIRYLFTQILLLFLIVFVSYFNIFPFLKYIRIRTYEHEAMWGKALASYDLHANLPEVTRQVGIMEVKINLCDV